ncbi:MAG: helix-turn-helix transcriptional regulator [Candidatus Marinimicrobia bacterium]|nr:helix-turn-helix transcriptional regulator [Candidatus Neomarinimicrobiota bacterium]
MNKERNILIGQKIKQGLNFEGSSVKELSKETGIPLQTLYSIISGHQSPSLEKIETIANALSLSIDTLLDIEINSLPVYPNPHQEGQYYANFENRWFGKEGGERISVSRNLSTANQSIELRKEILEKIYKTPTDRIDISLKEFSKRLDVIESKELNRLEIVVESELEDFISQRSPWDTISSHLIEECITKLIDKLTHSPLKYEVIIIPRQHFLVNYEIIKRQVLLFDLGSVFYRQNHPKMVQHFLSEVENFKYKYAKINRRDDVIKFFKKQLENK